MQGGGAAQGRVHGHGDAGAMALKGSEEQRESERREMPWCTRFVCLETGASVDVSVDERERGSGRRYLSLSFVWATMSLAEYCFESEPRPPSYLPPPPWAGVHVGRCAVWRGGMGVGGGKRKRAVEKSRQGGTHTQAHTNTHKHKRKHTHGKRRETRGCVEQARGKCLVCNHVCV